MLRTIFTLRPLPQVSRDRSGRSFLLASDIARLECLNYWNEMVVVPHSLYWGGSRNVNLGLFMKLREGGTNWPAIVTCTGHFIGYLQVSFGMICDGRET